MKRVTISMSDSVHKKITEYAENHDVSFSKACSHLAAIGQFTSTADDASDLVMNHLIENNIKFYMVGNFDVPNSVIKRSMSHAISGSSEESPLIEFAKIVGA